MNSGEVKSGVFVILVIIRRKGKSITHSYRRTKAMEDLDEVFDAFDEVVEELWSSPLMDHRSPFEDYKDLYEGICSGDQNGSVVFKFPAKASE